MKISKDGICSFLKGFIVAVLILALSPAYAIGENEAEESLIIIGGDYDFPPYEFLDEDGNPTGYNVELTRAIAKVMGMNVVVNLGSWAETYHALEIGKIDAVHGMCYSTERDQKFDFTPPHTMMSHVVFTRQNSPKISSLEDLRDKEVIVMRGSIMHEYVMKNQLTDKIVLVETQPKALRLLSSGKHDFALMARLSALYSIKKMKLSNILATDIMVGERNYCHAVKEGNIQIHDFSLRESHVQTHSFKMRSVRQIDDQGHGTLRQAHQLVGTIRLRGGPHPRAFHPYFSPPPPPGSDQSHSPPSPATPHPPDGRLPLLPLHNRSTPPRPPESKNWLLLGGWQTSWSPSCFSHRI